MPTRKVAGLGLLTIILSFLTIVVPTAPAQSAPKAKPPSVSVADAPTMTEGDSATAPAFVTFTVKLKKGNGKKTKVSWTTVDGTAKAGSDYVAASGKLTFKGAEKKQSQTIRIRMIGDDTVEPDETFQVQLTKIKNGVIKRATAKGTIRNDDDAPVFRALTVDVAGGGSVTSDPAGIDCGIDCSESYLDGTEVTLTADPGPTYDLTGWTGACAGEPSDTCVVSMTTARNVGATFAVATRSVSVSTNGSGSGRVTSDPIGIDCGVTCSAAYTKDGSVTLTADADPGSTFVGWTGDCTGDGDCTLTMGEDRTASAEFAAIPLHQLAVTKTGNGSGSVSSNPAGISCGSTCSASYLQGQVVTLSAASSSSSEFTGWSGDCSGTGTCQVTMAQARSVTAEFTLKTYPLTVFTTGSGSVTSSPGSISCPSSCMQSFNHGTTVNLTASAATGYQFSSWIGACTGPGACSVDMTQARTVTAQFTVKQYALQVTKEGAGSGTVFTSGPVGGIDCGGTCSATYVHGSTIELTANPESGSTFDGWTSPAGICSGTGTCTVEMTQARTVTASFSLQSRTLTLTKTGTGAADATVVDTSLGVLTCGPVTCAGTYPFGTSVTLSTTTPSGDHFLGWTGGGCDVIGTADCTVVMNQDQNLSANFYWQDHTLHITIVGPPGSVTLSDQVGQCTVEEGQCLYLSRPHGAEVVLRPVPPNTGWFDHWTGCDSYTPLGYCVLNMLGDRAVTATFGPP